MFAKSCFNTAFLASSSYRINTNITFKLSIERTLDLTPGLFGKPFKVVLDPLILLFSCGFTHRKLRLFFSYSRIFYQVDSSGRDLSRIFLLKKALNEPNGDPHIVKGSDESNLFCVKVRHKELSVNLDI